MRLETLEFAGGSNSALLEFLCTVWEQRGGDPGLPIVVDFLFISWKSGLGPGGKGGGGQTV
jgi:hypothetical protein